MDMIPLTGCQHSVSNAEFSAKDYDRSVISSGCQVRSFKYAKVDPAGAYPDFRVPPAFDQIDASKPRASGLSEKLPTVLAVSANSEIFAAVIESVAITVIHASCITEAEAQNGAMHVLSGRMTVWRPNCSICVPGIPILPGGPLPCVQKGKIAIVHDGNLTLAQ